MTIWIVEPALTPDGRGTGCYDIFENTEQGRFIATVDDKTDAALIKTAPELLDACRSALADLEGLAEADCFSIDDPAHRTMQELRATIARATGGAV